MRHFFKYFWLNVATFLAVAIPFVVMIAVAVEAATAPAEGQAPAAAEAHFPSGLRTPDGGFIYKFGPGWECFHSDIVVTGNRFLQVECFRVP